MKLYNHSLAPNPRRVRIFAAEKNIELSLEDVDILAGQSRAPEFLAKNSSGGLPVLELDDGSYLSESVAICRYLEGLHPEPNLLGRDLREQAEIERWNRRMELELFAAIGRTIQNTSPIFQGRFKQFSDYGEAMSIATSAVMSAIVKRSPATNCCPFSSRSIRSRR
jgi:glutathione S-transferase